MGRSIISVKIIICDMCDARLAVVSAAGRPPCPSFSDVNDQSAVRTINEQLAVFYAPELGAKLTQLRAPKLLWLDRLDFRKFCCVCYRSCQEFNPFIGVRIIAMSRMIDAIFLIRVTGLLRSRFRSCLIVMPSLNVIVCRELLARFD